MKKKADDKFDHKILEMNLTKSISITKEEEELAWKEILMLMNKKEVRKFPRYWIAAASVLAVALVLFFAMPGTDKKYSTGSNETLKINSVDGSQIILNRNSKLKLENGFGSISRNVSLNGEAFFDVKRDTSIHFIIHAGNRMVTVLGTSFNVQHVQHTTTVSVQSGTVKLSMDNDYLILTAGEKGIINGSGDFLKTTPELNDYSWFTDTLDFKNKTLQEVVKTLSKLAGKPVEVNSKIAQCKLTLHIKYKKLEEVYDIIAETLDIKWKEENNQIIFTGNGC
jgi:ferric-dicitrate binding protein FerR (iron transport regulator)